MTVPAHVSDPWHWPLCRGESGSDMVAPGRLERRPVTVVGTIGETLSMQVGDEPPTATDLARSQWVALWPSVSEADAAAHRWLHSVPDTRLPFEAWDVLMGNEETPGYYTWLVYREAKARGNGPG